MLPDTPLDRGRETMLRRLLGLAAAATLLGCGSTKPSPIAGTWNATVFTITSSGAQPVNVLQQGGSLSITITSDNTTSGSLVIPASLTGSSPITNDMAGVALIVNGTVIFEQAADTFVRDVTWTIGDNTLTTTEIVSGVTLDITLLRVQRAP
jgi:hypothetical protein